MSPSAAAAVAAARVEVAGGHAVGLARSLERGRGAVLWRRSKIVADVVDGVFRRELVVAENVE